MVHEGKVEPIAFGQYSIFLKQLYWGIIYVQPSTHSNFRKFLFPHNKKM